MKKIILYVAASLDQRIAEPDETWIGLPEFPTPKKPITGTKTCWVRSIQLSWVVKPTVSC